MDVDVGYDARFSFILPSTISPNSIVQVEIIVIIIPEYKDGDSDKWNKTCEQLLPLQKLILAFSSKEEMTRFVRDVVNTEMDELCSVDRVKYVVLQGDPEDGMLVQAFVDSEELKGKHHSLPIIQFLIVMVLCRNWLEVL